MKYSPKQYAVALSESLAHADGQEFSNIVKLFLHSLKKNNSLKLLPKILKEVERLEAGSTARILSAKTLPEAVANTFREILGVKKIEQKTAPELLGGAVIEWDDWRLDASVRGRLTELRSVLTK